MLIIPIHSDRRQSEAMMACRESVIPLGNTARKHKISLNIKVLNSTLRVTVNRGYDVHKKYTFFFFTLYVLKCLILFNLALGPRVLCE